MTTASTTSYTAAVANGTAPIPFTFQALSTGEIAVLRAGVLQTLGVHYSVTLNGDDTGSIVPLASWGTDPVLVYSNPNLQQPFQFTRFGAFYPDQFNGPLDRLARIIIAFNSRLNRAPLLPVGENGPLLPSGWAGGSGGGGALTDGSVGLVKLANIAAASFVGNNLGVPGVPLALTAAQAAVLLPAAVGDTGTGGVKGLVPAPAAGDAAAGKYLKADLTWATPPGGGGGAGTTSSALTFATSGGVTPGTNFTGAVARTIDFSSIGAAPLDSPHLTGIPTTPTPTLGDNSTKIASTAFVKGSIDAVIAAAPGALDTLNELATALGNDPNFATTITTSLAGKAPARPTIGTPSASFSAADADNNTHKVFSGAGQTLTLPNITAGTSFTGRYTTAWSVACAGGVSKNGAAPAGVTAAAIAANSVITHLHEGAGVWLLTGAGLS